MKTTLMWDEERNVLRVIDFHGFTEEWDEIVTPISEEQREIIQKAKQDGWSIEYDSDEI